jgi:hypothetical protein
VGQNSTNNATRDQDRPWDLISHWSLKHSDSLTERINNRLMARRLQLRPSSTGLSIAI